MSARVVGSDDGGRWRRDFGARVRELRTVLGLSQEALAFAAGISTPYVSDVENGKRSPGLDVLVALAQALGVSLSELFEGVDVGEDSRTD